MKYIRLSVIVLLISLLVSACSGGGGSFSSGGGSSSSSSGSDGGTSLVTVSIVTDTHGSVASRSTTTTISKLVFTISADDMSTVTKSVDVSGDSEVTESFTIDNGDERRFGVEAKDSSGSVLYSGSTTVDLDGSDVTLSITMTAADTTAPQVVSVSPSDGATGASVSSPITITFSESINPDTFSYGLSSDASGSVMCSAGINGAVATLTPYSAFSYGTEYKVMVEAGVSDTAGNAMSAPYVWIFTTSAYPDTTAPWVTAVSPGINATGVVGSATVTATFSEALDPASITASTFTLKNGTGSAVAGSVTYAGTTAVFTPLSQLPVSNTYTSIVTTGVRDISGNYMASNYLWQFKTKGWINPASLADNISQDGQDAYPPQVAMDNKGNAIVVWHQTDSSGDSQIYKAEYRGGVWTYPSSLSDHLSPGGTGTSASDPQVAMDNIGNAIVTWSEYDGLTSDHIYKAEYRGGVWTKPASLTDYISSSAGGAIAPQVAMDDNGNAIITWHEYNAAYYQVYKAEYRGGAWTYPSSAYISPAGQSAYSPQVAMANNGSALIAWFQSDGTSFQVFKAEYHGGAWTYPASLTDNISPDVQYAQEPRVAMDNNGNAIITWYEDDGLSAMQIFKAEYRGGVWTYPASLTDNISPDGQGAISPEVAMDDNGGAIITWAQDDGLSAMQIFKAEYRGGVWTYPASPTDNISMDGQSARYPKVSMDNSGGAIITWFQWDDTSYGNNIYKAEYRSGAWSGYSAVANNIDPNVEGSPNPDVAMSDNGNAVLVWPQLDATSTAQIFKSEFR